MTVSDTEFITIVQAAADFDDYLYGKYFVPRRESFRVHREVHGFRTESLAQFLVSSQSVSSRTGSPLRLRDPSILPPWAIELRHMLDALPEHNLITRQASPLHRLCECGSHYGLQRLKEQISPALLDHISQEAEARLDNDLRQTLARATRPCFALKLEAFRLASEAIWFRTQGTTPKTTEMRLAAASFEQLFSMFRTLPVLARLWSQLISQWCNHISELLSRLSADRRALSKAFFRGERIDKIVDLRTGLSDPHNRGRTVVLLQFEVGSIIYKPRTGDGEWEWLKVLRWMNSQSFRPNLRAARVLRRDGYCWMEHIQPGPCKDQNAARRFYQRAGGMLGAAYLLEAVDCHRDNVIACGEYPVLIDAETLCHAMRERKTQSLLDPLYETGFLPRTGQRSSCQYQSSVLGRTTLGHHAPKIAAKPLSAVRYEMEIINGFRRAWRCLIGTTRRRVAFVRRLQRLQCRERRWIYWPTRNYDAIRRASIQPATLRSGVERDLLIGRLSARRGVPEVVIREEVNALKQFDIPYFTRKTTAGPLPEDNAAPTEIVESLRHALHL